MDCCFFAKRTLREWPTSLQPEGAQQGAFQNGGKILPVPQGIVQQGGNEDQVINIQGRVVFAEEHVRVSPVDEIQISPLAAADLLPQHVPAMAAGHVGDFQKVVGMHLRLVKSRVKLHHCIVRGEQSDEGPRNMARGGNHKITPNLWQNHLFHFLRIKYIIIS